MKVKQVDKSVQLTPRLINVEEYHKMGEHGILDEKDRLELIQGQIVHMSPIGSRHAAYVDKILGLLSGILPPDEVILRVQNPISLDDLSEPEPDTTLLKPTSDYYVSGHPGPQDILLIIEVADTSYPYDRYVKSELYATAGIPAYCIVHIEKKEIELFHQPAEKLYKQIQICLPGDTVEFKSLDIAVQANDMLI